VIRTTGAILRKDLLLELRTKESVPAMTLFTLTVYVLFHFGLDRDSLDGELAAGVLWVTLLLAAVIGVTRLFAAEREQGGIEGLLLAPVDRTALFVAKAWVDPGPIIKRFQPKDRGKAYPINKRTSHITVIVEHRPEADSQSGTSKRNRRTR
jgi:hypothetical protein